jgi:Ribonuclease G/E
MPEETCVQVNCCPLGYTVPKLVTTLSLAGDDSTATDPNIANGELILAENDLQLFT